MLITEAVNVSIDQRCNELVNLTGVKFQIAR